MMHVLKDLFWYLLGRRRWVDPCQVFCDDHEWVGIGFDKCPECEENEFDMSKE